MRERLRIRTKERERHTEREQGIERESERKRTKERETERERARRDIFRKNKKTIFFGFVSVCSEKNRRRPKLDHFHRIIKN